VLEPDGASFSSSGGVVVEEDAADEAQ